VSAPRLRRLLARPEWIARTETRTRQTRTGTRTGTVLNASLLPELRASLETSGAPIDAEGKPEERERERDETGTRTRTGTVRNENENATQDDDGSDWRARALVAEARAELLERERNDWKEQAAGALEALQRAQDEARAARLIGGREIRQVESSETLSEDPKQTRAWWPFTRKRKVE
jgi:hypothetical protein